MTPDVGFQVEWLATDDGNDSARATYGELTVRAGNIVLTDVIDLIAQTPRNSIRVSLDHLARWIVDHWWRLRWEPMPSGTPSTDWRLAHEIGAAGGGFVWPKMCIASDGDSLRVQTTSSQPMHTIRYVADRDIVCQAAGFERGIDDFLNTIIARLRARGVVDTDLEADWNAVLQERQAPELYRFRKQEALMGLNPDEVEPDRLDDLFRKGSWLGEGALGETLVNADYDEVLDRLDRLEELRERPSIEFSTEKVIQAIATWQQPKSLMEPWRKAESFADHLRGLWELGTNPITDEFLNDLFHADIHSGELGISSAQPFVAFRQDHCLRPFLKPTRFKTTRRFAVARLLGDTAVAAPSDVAHLSTNTHTARQKFQRAMAQAFLCPVEGLKERLSLPYPDSDEIVEAADYYQVSEQVVTTTLVNKRLVERSYLEEAS